MADFEKHIDDLIRKEGGYKLINVKHDRGGMTYAGISRKNNPQWDGWQYIDAGDEVPNNEVREFYAALYWDKMKLDGIHSEAVASVLLSSCVLSGVRRASRMAQVAAGVKVDGYIGPKTLTAINATEPRLFVALFALLRIDRFREIANRNKTQRKFLRGWINRVYEEMK